MVKLPAPKPKGPPPRPAHVGFRTSNEIKRAAVRAAKADKVTLSAWIELAVVERLERRGK
jgi:predicted HicB family RNase H-like nuclease